MPTIWEVAPGFDGDRVKLADGKAELAFTVRNPGTAPDRVMFSVVPGPGVDPDWFTIDEPQRPVGAGATTSYLVRLEVPPGTAPGAYELQMRAYSADSAPASSSSSASWSGC
jgi:hypothetical protein